MDGFELQQKYGITIVNHSLFLDCSEMCLCGHPAKEHHGEGTAGWCEGCGRIYGAIHNFIPVDVRVATQEEYKEWLRKQGKLEEPPKLGWFARLNKRLGMS